MDTIGLFFDGVANAFTPANLLAALIGCVLGMVVGVLPGIGPASAIALLLPVTIGLGPTASIIMLAAIYYGSMYGGTITSVLLNTPGEAASVVTTFDGYQMARRGEAGKALGIAAIGSFIGGSIGILGLVLVAVPLSSFALRFGPVEQFMLLALGLVTLISLSGKSVVTGLMMGTVGLVLGLVGIDPVEGAARYTFGSVDLLAGLDLVAVVIGLFGVSEVLTNLEQPLSAVLRPAKVGSLMPNRSEWRRSIPAIGRGTGIGFVLGLIPGMNAALAAFLAYSAEKRSAKTPLGTGAIEGVAAPETANNAYTSGAMVPLLTLGVPSSPVTALLLGAFLLNGLIPGPALFRDNPALVWAVIGSLLVGNIVLLIMNLPLIRVWVLILKIPYPILLSAILVLCVVGSYGVNNSLFDVGVMVVFGVAGYFFKKLDLPLAPLILGFVLGPLMERALRTSLEISNGNPAILVSSPIAIGVLCIALVVLAASTIARFRRVLPENEDAEV